MRPHPTSLSPTSRSGAAPAYAPAYAVATALVLALGIPHSRPLSAQGAGALRQYATPAEAGFSATRLAALHQRADSVTSGAVVALHRGRVLVAWGDIARPIPAHSVRKSLVSALFGITIASGEVDLDATLGDLAIDDRDGLTALERSAKVSHLLAARSGVFLPAAYAPSDQDSARPPRGSHEPGEHWFYNNWDFNAAGVILERATGRDLYEVFDQSIAGPIGMEDYTPADGFRVWEPSASRHPAHTFDISARDLARFGQLYMQNGRWNGRQLIPAAWVRESTRPHTDFGNGTGYGYMWWTYRPGALGTAYPNLDRHELYMARGTGGQAIFVVPGAELVIVHRGDTENGRGVAGVHVWAIAEGILDARERDAVAGPSLVDVSATPFASQRPRQERRYIAIEPAVHEELVGSYDLGPSATVRVFMYEGRLFINVPGEGEAELFAVSRDEYVIRVAAGVTVRFDRSPDGAVSEAVLRLGSREMRGRRR